MRLLACLSALFLAAATSVAAQDLSVVTTIPDLESMVRTIGGDRVETHLLVKPGFDPHRVRGKPSVLLKLQRADGLILMGLDYEHAFLPALLEKCRNDAVEPGGSGYMNVGARIEPLEVPERIDRGQGADLHPRGNPHYNLDPENGRIMARAARDLLVRIDPEHASDYDRRWKAWDARAVKKIGEWSKRLEPFRGRALVAYHDSWPYFVNRFGLRMVGHVEPKPGLAPTARHLLELTRTMEEEEVKVILIEPWYNQRDVASLLRATDAELLKLAVTAGYARGTRDYLDFIEHLVRSLENALSES